MSLTLRSEPVRRIDDWDAVTLCELADEHGTPLYVTDLERVRENYRRIDRSFMNAEVMYAAKANTGRAVINALYDEGAVMECAAAAEIKRILDTDVTLDKIQYTAMNPPSEDLDYIVNLWQKEQSLTATAGAEDTLDRLASRGFDGQLLLRVNPGIGAGHHEKVAMGKDAKFGIPAERIPEVAERAREEFDFIGIHAHVGSGILGNQIDAYIRALKKVADVAREIQPIEMLDVGGGYGVPYHPDEEPLDLDRVAEATFNVVGDIDAQIAIEPGRYVVADASVLITEVNTRKEASNATVIGTDASMCTLMRPAMFDAYHPIRNLSAQDKPTERVTVGGPLCTSADVFCTDRPITRPEREDLLAIGNAGAYGYEFTSNFHSQLRPAEVAIEHDETRVVRERETIDDLTRLEKP